MPTPLAFPPQGRPGTPGVQTGFGQVTYTDRTVGVEDSFLPGIRQQLMFAPGALQTQDLLNPPFAGHQFFVDNRIVPRAMGDLYDMRVNLPVTADQAGARLRLDIDTGSVLGPLQSDTTGLLDGTGTPERATFSFSVQVLATFLANGAVFFLHLCMVRPGHGTTLGRRFRKPWRQTYGDDLGSGRHGVRCVVAGRNRGGRGAGLWRAGHRPFPDSLCKSPKGPHPI